MPPTTPSSPSGQQLPRRNLTNVVVPLVFIFALATYNLRQSNQMNSIVKAKRTEFAWEEAIGVDALPPAASLADHDSSQPATPMSAPTSSPISKRGKKGTNETISSSIYDATPSEKKKLKKRGKKSMNQTIEHGRSESTPSPTLAPSAFKLVSNDTTDSGISRDASDYVDYETTAVDESGNTTASSEQSMSVSPTEASPPTNTTTTEETESSSRTSAHQQNKTSASSESPTASPTSVSTTKSKTADGSNFSSEPSKPSPPLTESESSPAIDAVCSRIPEGKSPSKLWYDQLDQIEEAIIHPLDFNKTHAAWMKRLIRFVSPSFLQQAIKGSPQQAYFTRLFEKLGQRILALGQNDESAAPPLKIMIFGGSVIEGSGCPEVPTELGVSKKALEGMEKLKLRDCAYPYRIEHFLNTMFGNKVIEVHNLAVGGTSSENAGPIFRHWLSDSFKPDGPDILIHAYSTNDHLPRYYHAKDNTTVDNFNHFLSLGQNTRFMHAALESRLCKEPPLVYYVSEYIGAQQQSILGDGFMYEVVQTFLAQGNPRLGYLSTGHLLRQIALADTKETVFSGRPTRDQLINVHFGQSGHVVIALTLAYATMEASVRFCEGYRESVRMASAEAPPLTEQEQKFNDIYEQTGRSRSHPDLIKYDKIKWHADIEEDHSVLPSAAYLYSKNYSQVWTQSESEAAEKYEAYCGVDAPQGESLCEFAFLAAPLGTHHQDFQLNKYLKTFMNTTSGWKAENDFRQGGYQNKRKSVPISCFHVHVPMLRDFLLAVDN